MRLKRMEWRERKNQWNDQNTDYTRGLDWVDQDNDNSRGIEIIKVEKRTNILKNQIWTQTA